jgi:hypothetical protein
MRIGITRLERNHGPAEIPFLYPKHDRIHSRAQELLREEAFRNRNAKVPYDKHTQVVGTESMFPRSILEGYC